MKPVTGNHRHLQLLCLLLALAFPSLAAAFQFHLPGAFVGSVGLNEAKSGVTYDIGPG